MRRTWTTTSAAGSKEGDTVMALTKGGDGIRLVSGLLDSLGAGDGADLPDGRLPAQELRR